MRTAAVILIVVILALVAGCSQQSPSPAIPATPSPVPPTFAATPVPTSLATTLITQAPTLSVSANTITISGYAFNPAEITVKAGSTVRWVNGDPVVERIQFDSGIKSQTMSPGESWSQVFNDPGIYNYSSMMYPSLQGAVIVV